MQVMTFTALAAALAWIFVIAFPLLVQAAAAAAAAAASVHARLFLGCCGLTLHASLTWQALSRASRLTALLPHTTRLGQFTFFNFVRFTASLSTILDTIFCKYATAPFLQYIFVTFGQVRTSLLW